MCWENALPQKQVSCRKLLFFLPYGTHTHFAFCVAGAVEGCKVLARNAPPRKGSAAERKRNSPRICCDEEEGGDDDDDDGEEEGDE